MEWPSGRSDSSKLSSTKCFIVGGLDKGFTSCHSQLVLSKETCGWCLSGCLSSKSRHLTLIHEVSWESGSSSKDPLNGRKA